MPLLPLADVPGHFARLIGEKQVCAVIADEQLTWGQLDERSNQFAHLLISSGVRHDDLVTVALPNSPAFLVATFGIYKASATPHIVSPNLPLEELQAIAALAEPAVTVGDSCLALDHPAKLPGDVDISGQENSQPEFKVASSCKAMSSGGSTGRPKIIVSHDAAEADTESEVFGVSPGANVMFGGPLYHNSPFLTALLALGRGCKIVGPRKFDPEGALRTIQDEKINWAVMVPTMMHRIWRLPETVRLGYDLSSLLCLAHSAAPMPQWLKQHWIDWLGADRIYEMYGGTEATGITMMSGEEWLQRPGSVGRFSDGSKIRVIDDEGNDLPVGKIGELYVLPQGDPNVSPFYYIGAEPTMLDGGWISIGDIGSVDEEGYIYLADRRTDLIISGGANIFPAEVEAALQEHPGVRCAVIVGLPDDDLGQRAHAIIEPEDSDHSPTEAELRSYVSEKLVLYKTPRSYEFSSVALRDEAGKVRRSKLRDMRISPT